MELCKNSNAQKKQRPAAVFLYRKEMKTLEELAFQVLIRHINSLCSKLKMTNLSYLKSKLKSISFAEHEALYTLPLLEELTLFAFDMLDYRLTQKVLNDAVKFFQSFKDVTSENFKSQFLNAVKNKFLHVLPESAIKHGDNNIRKEALFSSYRCLDVDFVKFLRSVLQEFTRINSSECDMNMPCLEQLKTAFQCLGVSKLCSYIKMFTEDIQVDKKFDSRKFSKLEKMFEDIPEMLCNIINDFLHAELHKTKHEYIYYALKQALNEKMPSEMYTKITDVINEFVNDDIPFATKKKLTSLLSPETCTNLFLSDLKLISNVKDFTKLKMLSIRDNCFDGDIDIQSLKCLKYLKITANNGDFSDKLSSLRCPNQLEAIILKGIMTNKDILCNLISWTPLLKQLDVSLKIPGGYVYIGEQLKELEELKIKHIDLYPKYRMLFLYLPDGMKKLTCNCIWVRWLTYLSSNTSCSLSEVCFQELICDSPFSSQLSGLNTVTLSESTFQCQYLFINVGRQLTSLILKYCSSVDLVCIAAHCPNLLNLKFIFCSFEDYDHLNSPQFPQLKTAYIDPACESKFCGWCLIAHSTELEEIVALSPSSNSKCFERFIDVNPLSHLKKFGTRVGRQSWLTAEQAQKIVTKCKQFKVVKCTEPKKEQTYQSSYGLFGEIKRGFYVTTSVK